MNRKQRACAVAAFFLLVASLLFAPTHPYRSPLVRYSFLFTGQGSIDFGRLFAEWVLIVLVSGALFLALSKSKNSSTEIRSESSTVSPRKGRILPLLTATLAGLVLSLGVVSYREIKKVQRLEAYIQNRERMVDTVKQMVNAIPYGGLSQLSLSWLRVGNPTSTFYEKKDVVSGDVCIPSTVLVQIDSEISEEEERVRGSLKRIKEALDKSE